MADSTPFANASFSPDTTSLLDKADFAKSLLLFDDTLLTLVRNTTFQLEVSLLLDWILNSKRDLYQLNCPNSLSETQKANFLWTHM